ncbi:MAG: SH3 domain-containing protein [Saprospiraceae bacterium]|nr:SH3 domain-containing protein [Saprospiraceae bacterium]
MRFSYYFPILLLVLLLMACNKKSDSVDTAEKNTTQPLNRDSIRQVYESLIKTKKNLLPAAQIVETGRLRPVDEGPSDTVFFVFREEMLKVIEQRNEFRLLEMVHHNIHNGFGGDGGIAGFVEGWKLDTQQDSSALWQTLKDVLLTGGTFSPDRQTFTAPYYIATFPNAYESDVFGVIIGEGVRVRAAPGLNTQVLKTISYAVLPVLDWKGEEATIDGETHPWIKVKLTDNQEGYVFGKFIRSPQDYSAIFTRQANGSWLMTSFGSGD